MEIKWFFVLFGIAFTFAILTGMYFINANQSIQDLAQYKSLQQSSNEKFNNSTVVHKYLFDNITDLKKGIDPLLEQIPNATQSRIDQDAHYNQSNQLNKILLAMGNDSEIIEQNKQDHQLLVDINQTLSALIVKEGVNSNITTTAGGSGTVVGETQEIQKQNNELLVAINKTMMGFLNDIPIN